MIKGSIQEEDIAIVNIYALNTGEPQYIGQTLTDIGEKLTVIEKCLKTLTPHSH